MTLLYTTDGVVRLEDNEGGTTSVTVVPPREGTEWDKEEAVLSDLGGGDLELRREV